MEIFPVIWFGIVFGIIGVTLSSLGTAKIYDRYGESGAIAFVILLLFSIGILTIMLPSLISLIEKSTLTCDYYATLDVPSMNLQEEYVYHVKSGVYHGLYRRWKIPLVIKLEENVKPNVTLIGVKSVYPYYARDHRGRVFVWNGDRSEARLVKKHAKPNEVGIVSSYGFYPGDYRAIYFFRIYSPIHTDGKYDHFNIKLADEHVPYEKVRIYVRDPKHLIVKLVPHFEGCKVEKTDSGYI